MSTQSDFRDLTPALQKAADQIRQFHNDEKAGIVIAAYGVGSAVATVLASHGAHGHRAVAHLVEYLDIAPAHLYCMFDLYRAFKPEFIHGCRNHVSHGGHVITLAHLAELSRVRDPELREMLVAKFYATDMPVEELHELIGSVSVISQVMPS